MYYKNFKSNLEKKLNSTCGITFLKKRIAKKTVTFSTDVANRKREIQKFYLGA